MSDTLHILHLEPTTGIKRVDDVAQVRYERMVEQLGSQGITDYKFHPGFFDRVNTKKAIHQGHKAIVLNAKEQGLQRVIIAEDDIIFTSSNSWTYFISEIPDSYDLFFGLIYVGEIDAGDRVLNGMSGAMSLYAIHERYYDTFLSQPDDNHVDRKHGELAHKHEFYCCSPMIVKQRGGYSFNLKKENFYSVYEEGKNFLI